MSKIFKEKNASAIMAEVKKLDPSVKTAPVSPSYSMCQEAHGGFGGTCTCGYECPTVERTGYVQIVTQLSGKRLHRLLKQINPDHTSIWEY